MDKNKTAAEMIKDENLALFGVEEIKITKEDLEKAKLANEKDKEALEVPTFTSINTKQ